MDPLDIYGNAISGIESGGRYGLLGPPTKSGDRAYGKYQVMGNNIPEWTQEALGQKLTPSEFLASPQAQEAVFKAKFGSYVNKYGPDGAARAWFAGPGGMNNPNAKDGLGTTVASYARQFNSSVGNKMDPTQQPLDQWLLGQQQQPPMSIDPATASAGGAATGGLFGQGGGSLGLGPLQQRLAQMGGGGGVNPATGLPNPQGQGGAMGLLAAAQAHPMQQQQMQAPMAPGHQPTGQMAMPQISYGPQGGPQLGALGGMATPMGGGTGGTGGAGGTGSGDPRLLGILRQYGLV